MQHVNTSANKIKICVNCQTLGDKDDTKESLTQRAPWVCCTANSAV